MTNLTRQLREVKMENRLDEILEEVVRVRRDFGYPVMATPFSQIVGAQAADNVISGERYRNITDSTIKYIMGFYGESAGTIDQNLMDKIVNLPRTKQIMSAPAVNYLKSVEEVRKEVGPELSDDELLLKIMVPGKPGKRVEFSKQASAPAAKSTAPGGLSTDFPREFSVEVDGEVFSVRITPSGDGTAETTGTGGSGGVKTSKKPKEVPPGGVLCGMAGLVLSFEVKVGDKVSAGDLVAMVEAMKMRRHVTCPHGGVVKEICASEGEIVQPEDLLMVVD